MRNGREMGNETRHITFHQKIRKTGKNGEKQEQKHQKTGKTRKKNKKKQEIHKQDFKNAENRNEILTRF